MADVTISPRPDRIEPVPNVPKVQAIQIAKDAPAPTGGTVKPGVYRLVKSDWYSGPNGASGPLTGPDSIDSKAFRIVKEPNGIMDGYTRDGFLMVAPVTTNPVEKSIDLDAVHSPYSASGNTLKLQDTWSELGTHMSTYQRSNK